jgi:hypothetical protein
MSSYTAFETIEQRLQSSWSTTALAFENDGYQLPGTPAPFVYVEIVGNIYDQESIGGGTEPSDNLWREFGQLYLHVMTPNGTGSGKARQLCDQLIALFQGLDIGSLTFRDASIGAGEPGQTFSGYYAMTATIAWYRDE